MAIDLADSRLDAARKFGADFVVNSGRDDPAAVIADLTGGLGADVTMGAVGLSQTFEQAVQLVRPGGMSPLSVCTVRRRRCICRTSGSRT